jgi:hypothetical protein
MNKVLKFFYKKKLKKYVIRIDQSSNVKQSFNY